MGTGCLTHRFTEKATSVEPSGQIKVLKFLISILSIKSVSITKETKLGVGYREAIGVQRGLKV